MNVKTIEDLRKCAITFGYELRKKGVKREKHNEIDGDGNPIKNCFFPHIAITASGYARTWKLFDSARAVFGYGNKEPQKTAIKKNAVCAKVVGTMNGDLWEEKLLLGLEHIVRYLKHDIGSAEMRAAIDKLLKPLDKGEYLCRKSVPKIGVARKVSGEKLGQSLGGFSTIHSCKRKNS